MLGHWKPQEFPFLDGSYWTLPLQLMGFTAAALLRRSRWGHGGGLRVVLWVTVLLPLALWPVRSAGPPEAYRLVVDGALRWLASISYGLYLVHQTIGYVLMRRLHDLGASPLEQCAAMLAAGLLLGWLLTVLIEQPAHRALMSSYDHRLRRFWAGSGGRY